MWLNTFFSRLKNKFKNKIYFFIEKYLFLYRQNKERKKNLRSIDFFVLKKLFSNLISLLLIIIIILFTDNLIINKFELVAIDNSELMNYIVGGLGIAGIFLGLYSSNVISIYTSRYTDAPERLRELFEKDPLTNKIINTISNYFFVCMITLILLILNINLGFIYILWISLYTLIILVSYKKLGNSSLNLVDSFNLSDEPIRNSKLLFKDFETNYRNKISRESMHYHVQKRISKNITDLQLISKYNLESGEKINRSALEFSLKLFGLLFEYWKYSDVIVFDSKWYKNTYEYPKWHQMDSDMLDIYIETKSYPPSNSVINYKWFEEELLEIEKNVINYFVEEKDLDSLSLILKILENLSSDISSLEQLEIMFDFLSIISIQFEPMFTNNGEYYYEEKRTQLVEAISVLYCKLFILSQKIIKQINYNELYENYDKKKKNINFLNNKKYRQIFESLEVEKKIEGKQVTPKKYIIDEMEKDGKQYIGSFLRTTYITAFESLLIKGKKLLSNKYELESYLLFINMSKLEIELLNLAEYLDLDEKEKIDKMINEIDELLLECTFSTFEKVEKLDIDFPDVVGYLYNIYLDKLFNLIVTNNLNQFREDLHKLFKIVTYQTKNIQKEENFRKNKNYIVMVSLPNIEYTMICGYACLWGDLNGTDEWKNSVIKELKYKRTDKELLDECIKQVSFCNINKEMKLSFTLNRGFSNVKWEMKFIDAIKRNNLLVYTDGEYGNRLLEIENKLAEKFLGKVKVPVIDPMFYYSISEYYAVSVLNEYLPNKYKFITTSSWDKERKSII